jgi:hypothetical protein
VIDDTLKLLDAWYNEPSTGGDRPKLLSKLATLELCGWLEGEFDRLALVAENGRVDDASWVHTKVIKNTSGFAYERHWRPMLQMIVGEVFVRRIERKMEVAAPGDLERLKTHLSTLWELRCGFAHADMNANIAAQRTFNAPSWAINQHRIICKLLARYESEMRAALSAI